MVEGAVAGLTLDAVVSAGVVVCSSEVLSWVVGLEVSGGEALSWVVELEVSGSEALSWVVELEVSGGEAAGLLSAGLREVAGGAVGSAGKVVVVPSPGAPVTAVLWFPQEVGGAFVVRLSGLAGGEISEESFPPLEMFAGEDAVVRAGEGPPGVQVEGS